MSGNDVQDQPRQVHVSLNPHSEARAIVRLLQCPQCSYPFRQPMTLPCGQSLCKECMPPLFKRENITYPMIPGRSEGFVCPFTDCGAQHTLGDCSVDITLNKIIETSRSYIRGCDPQTAETSETAIQLDEQLYWPSIVDSSIDVMPRSRVLHGGKLVATFTLAEMGELNYHSGVEYTLLQGSENHAVDLQDQKTGSALQEIVRGEVECQVCYAVMVHPLTTSCGHTFCQKCVARVLDHSTLCPICRRRLAMPPGVEDEPANKGLSDLISNLLAEQLNTRLTTADAEEMTTGDGRVPLFPCTLAYPLMPTFLHIFEPRYRLMIRRVLENGTRRFGLLAYNSSRRPQGDLGHVPFLQYGTMLNIQRIEMFPDGRSLVETTGIHRFRVLEYSMLDGYLVGKIQRVDDIPLAEEEEIEARETSVAEPSADDVEGRLNVTSTQGLLQIGLNFIQQAKSRSADWLHERVLAAYGQPPSDPATFPYWFASVLPISEDEKYLLLPTTSVRERLKMTARWVQRLEAARW